MSPPLAQLTCPSRSFLSDSPLRLPGLPKPIKSTSHSHLRLPYVRPRCAVPPLQLQLLPLLLLPVADAPTLTPIYAILHHRSLLAPLLHHTTVPLSPRPTHTHTLPTHSAPGVSSSHPSEPPKLSLSPSDAVQSTAARAQPAPWFCKNYSLTPPKNDDDDDTAHTPPPPPPPSSSSFSAFPPAAAAATSQTL